MTITTLDKEIFDLSLIIKQLLYNPEVSAETTLPAHEAKRDRLPKLDVPTFNGELLHWQTFWERFCITIHERSDISATEKLVYLRHAIKDGIAKSTIEGLSYSCEHYNKAVECLKSRYIQPSSSHSLSIRS